MSDLDALRERPVWRADRVNPVLAGEDWASSGATIFAATKTEATYIITPDTEGEGR